MVNLTGAFAALMLGTLAMSEAAVYIGGGCYDCNPPGGQGPGIYTGGGGNGAAGGGRGGGAYYNPGAGGGGGYYNGAPAAGGGGGGGGRPVFTGNFGPGYGNGGGGGGGGGYDGGATQIISG